MFDGKKYISVWINLVTSWLAFLTAVIGLSLALENSDSVADQEGRLSKLELCQGMTVEILKPSNSDHVGNQIDITGTASADDICRFVYIIVERHKAKNRTYLITDFVQTENNGRWAAKASLEHIPITEEARISVRLTGTDFDYAVDQLLGRPPKKGVRSNSVTVRRVR